MSIAELTFTRYPNSFTVCVDNLELLSVTQIQELQEFVDDRNGVFDFNTYSFSIQKRIEFNDFVSLINASGVKATCKEKILKVQQKAQVGFGKYKGMFYSDLPDAYLLWLKGNYRGKDRDIIDAELNFRTI
ncbi:DUF3820 family protein [Sulfurimonas sp.]|nr:DUF3820 family protein [Sulfurimonas sp.]